jgi:transposase InsO family protein
MRLQTLRARPPRRRLPKDECDRQVASVASNLLDRQFEAERPNQKWIADFTYIWTALGLALRVGRDRPVLAPSGRQVDEHQHDSAIGRGRPVDGCLAAQ